jgi:hypothetical protein
MTEATNDGNYDASKHEIKCRVNVKFGDCGEVSYEGFFKSTTDAVMSAEARFYPTPCKITVKEIA